MRPLPPAPGRALPILALAFMALLTAAWLPGGRAAAQGTASLNGYITDAATGETLLLASVAIDGTTRGASTNESGYYSIVNLPAGRVTVLASYIGYRPFRTELDLVAGQTTRLDIALQPESVQLEEVVVESQAEREARRNIGVSQVETELIKKLPSVLEPDVFRSIQLLPGVKAASDFSSGLYIRGGSSDQTLILLDQTTVYNPTHFFGFFSTFNPDAVKDVRLYKGGYPAEYGGRLGSVLTVFNKDGNRNETEGTLSLGLLASRASIEGPYKWGSYMLAVRRSTLEPLLAALNKTVDNIPDKFFFYDVNGKVNLDAGADDRLSLAFYAGTDVVNFPFTDDATIRLNYGNQTVSGNWRRIVSGSLFTSVTLTGSRYFNIPRFEIAGTPFDRRNNIYDISVKADAEYQPSESHNLTAGIWGGSLTLKLRDRFDGNVNFRSRIQSNYASVFLQDEWRPNERWVVNGGVRMNYFSDGDYLKPAPRLSVEHRPSERLRMQLAYGRYFQFLTLISNEAFSGFDVWLTTDRGVPPAWGDQFVAGVKTIPFQGYAFDAEVYYRTMNDLFELDPFRQDVAGLEYRETFRFGEGYAYGAELFLEKQTGRITGFVGYTFGVTRRKFPEFNAPLLRPASEGGARYYPPKYDRRHDANVVVSYRLGERWTANAVFSYGTGQAYTEPLGRTQFTGIPWSTEDNDAFVVGRVNASRLPATHRLDVSFSRFGRFFGLGDSEFKIQVINVYSRRNIWFYSYDFEDNPITRTEVPLLPILPAFSYSIDF